MRRRADSETGPRRIGPAAIRPGAARGAGRHRPILPRLRPGGPPVRGV